MNVSYKAEPWALLPGAKIDGEDFGFVMAAGFVTLLVSRFLLLRFLFDYNSDIDFYAFMAAGIVYVLTLRFRKNTFRLLGMRYNIVTAMSLGFACALGMGSLVYFVAGLWY